MTEWKEREGGREGGREREGEREREREGEREGKGGWKSVNAVVLQLTLASLIFLTSIISRNLTWFSASDS